MSRYFSSILRTHFPRHVSQTKNTIETKNHNKHLMNYSCKFICFLFRSITCEIFFPKLCCEVQLYIQKNYLKEIPKFEGPEFLKNVLTFLIQPAMQHIVSDVSYNVGLVWGVHGERGDDGVQDWLIA